MTKIVYSVFASHGNEKFWVTHETFMSRFVTKSRVFAFWKINVTQNIARFTNIMDRVFFALLGMNLRQGRLGGCWTGTLRVCWTGKIMCMLDRKVRCRLVFILLFRPNSYMFC